MNQPVPIEPLDMNDSLGESIIKEIADRKKEKTKHHEEDFQALIIKKIKDDIKNPHAKKAAVKLLIESFGNLLSDNKFLSWLANKLDHFPSRLKTLIDNHEKVFLPRNCFSNDVLKEIYHFSIKNSTPSADRRSGLEEMCITKMKCVHVHKHTLDFEYENITEFTKISTVFRYNPFYITPPSDRKRVMSLY